MRAVLRFFLKTRHRLRQTGWRWLFLYGHSGTLNVAPRVRLNVPVAANGKGLVDLADHIRFGYALAPKLGNGDILLQARDKGAVIKIGSHTIFSNNVSIVARSEITIGERCLIGDQVSITDADFHELSPEQRHEGHGKTAAVHIGNNVWLGSRVMILRGVTIGDGVVVAAGAIVTRDLPARALAAGVPAKVLRTL